MPLVFGFANQLRTTMTSLSMFFFFCPISAFRVNGKISIFVADYPDKGGMP